MLITELISYFIGFCLCFCNFEQVLTFIPKAGEWSLRAGWHVFMKLEILIYIGSTNLTCCTQNYKYPVVVSLCYWSDIQNVLLLTLSRSFVNLYLTDFNHKHKQFNITPLYRQFFPLKITIHIQPPPPTYWSTNSQERSVLCSLFHYHNSHDNWQNGSWTVSNQLSFNLIGLWWFPPERTWQISCKLSLTSYAGTVPLKMPFVVTS